MGKFIPALPQTGCAIMALEPVADMRDQVVRAYRDVTALAGSADNIPLADASEDAVVYAQVFHRFATPDAVAEMRRVLKPGGTEQRRSEWCLSVSGTSSVSQRR